MFGMIARSFFLFLFSFFLKFPPHGKCFNFGFSGGLKHRLQSRSSLRNSRRRLSTLEFKKAKRPNSSATTPEILNQVNNQIRKKKLLILNDRFFIEMETGILFFSPLRYLLVFQQQTAQPQPEHQDPHHGQHDFVHFPRSRPRPGGRVHVQSHQQFRKSRD